MENLNLLVVCSIVGEALALRMALASNREAMSNLMPLLKDCLTLLRAKLPWFRITRVTFYTLPIISNTKLGGSSWIIDSGCTNHMTGEKKMFSSYEKNQDPQRAITSGDGNQGLVKGLGKIAISPDHSISNVFLVDSLD
jgi:hypothetical protein